MHCAQFGKCKFMLFICRLMRNCILIMLMENVIRSALWFPQLYFLLHINLSRISQGWQSGNRHGSYVDSMIIYDGSTLLCHGGVVRGYSVLPHLREKQCKELWEDIETFLEQCGWPFITICFVDGHLCNLKKVIVFAKTSKVIENSCNLGIDVFSR